MSTVRVGENETIESARVVLRENVRVTALSVICAAKSIMRNLLSDGRKKPKRREKEV